MWRITADQPGCVNFTAALDSPHRGALTAVREDNQLALIGQVETNGVRFEARLRADVQGGKVILNDLAFTVEHADSVTLILAY